VVGFMKQPLLTRSCVAHLVVMIVVSARDISEFTCCMELSIDTQEQSAGRANVQVFVLSCILPWNTVLVQGSAAKDDGQLVKCVFEKSARSVHVRPAQRQVSRALDFV
jgi:hypothetical protein